MKWNQISIDALKNYCYESEEFSELVWSKDINIMCPEPFKYHVKVWAYIADEYYNDSTVMGIMINGRNVSIMNKWDYRRLDEEVLDRNDIYIIHLDDLVDSIDSASDDTEVDDIESLEAWNEYQRGKSRNDISEMDYNKLDDRIEYYMERQADILRGK